jgi:hypothetical protein
MHVKADIGESNTGLFRLPLNSFTKSSRFSVCPSGLTASRSKPNEQANSALACMAKFLVALIALAFAVLIGAFVFAAFTL